MKHRFPGFTSPGTLSLENDGVEGETGHPRFFNVSLRDIESGLSTILLCPQRSFIEFVG